MDFSRKEQLIDKEFYSEFAGVVEVHRRRRHIRRPASTTSTPKPKRGGGRRAIRPPLPLQEVLQR